MADRNPSEQPQDDGIRNARLYGLPPTPALCAALRTRPVPRRSRRIIERLLTKTGRLTYEQSWLDALQAGRAHSTCPHEDAIPRLLVRVDEFPYHAGLNNAKFGLQASRRFHAAMTDAGVKYLLSVVPQWTNEPINPRASGGRKLDDIDRAFLEEMRNTGVTFAQHGNTHRTRSSRSWRQSELCGLSPTALRALLDSGRRKLAEVDIDPHILVPPFNRFDAAQWPSLEQHYEIITGGPESILTMGFHCGPQWRGEALYLPCYAPLYATAAVIRPAIERLLGRGITGWIPIVLHVGWEVDDNYLALQRLATLIAPHAAPWDDLIARKHRTPASPAITSPPEVGSPPAPAS